MVIKTDTREMKSNFLTRTITGIAFVAVLIGGMLAGPFAFALVFGIITALTVWEFCTLFNQHYGTQLNRFITLVAAVYFFFAFAYFHLTHEVGIFIPYIVTLMYLLITELYFKNNDVLRNWAFSMMAQLYIAMPFALLSTLVFVPADGEFGVPVMVYSPTYVLALFIFLWTYDSGAFCFGSWLGRHRLFPRISPKKSWEGVVGGAIVAIAASQIIAIYFPHAGFTTLGSHAVWAGFAMTVVVFGTWGDLTESLLKRRLQIKDSGSILPGHGGMLDRFDSSLLAIPAVVVYLYIIGNGSEFGNMIHNFTAIFGQ